MPKGLIFPRHLGQQPLHDGGVEEGGDDETMEAVLHRVTPREPSSVVVPSSTRETVELLRHLDPDDRALVLLRYWYGFQATEIAGITDRSPAAVR